MTEDSLKVLSLGQLFDLMIQTINEYIALRTTIHNADLSEVKKTEIQLIQEVITSRKSQIKSIL